VRSVVSNTVKRSVVIEAPNWPEFEFLSCTPNHVGPLPEERLIVSADHAFLVSEWQNRRPFYLPRPGSARDLVFQIDREIAELSLQDAESKALISASLLHWLHKRLLLIGSLRARSALCLFLFSQGASVEGDWVCKLKAQGVEALPRSVRWNHSLKDRYPELDDVLESLPIHNLAYGQMTLSAWCPAAPGRPWRCSSGPIDAVIVVQELTDGHPSARVHSTHMLWGHLLHALFAGKDAIGLEETSLLWSLAGRGGLRVNLSSLAVATQSLSGFLRYC